MKVPGVLRRIPVKSTARQVAVAVSEGVICVCDPRPSRTLRRPAADVRGTAVAGAVAVGCVPGRSPSADSLARQTITRLTR
jgi:hypothetical protein